MISVEEIISLVLVHHFFPTYTMFTYVVNVYPTNITVVNGQCEMVKQALDQEYNSSEIGMSQVPNDKRSHCYS